MALHARKWEVLPGLPEGCAAALAMALDHAEWRPEPAELVGWR
jgi:hypothetical protein